MADEFPDIDLSLFSADGAFVFAAAVVSLLETVIKTTPAAQHARNHARVDRILTIIEEEILKLPPLEVP